MFLISTDQIKKKCRRNPLSTISSNDLLLNRTNNMRSGDLLKNMPYPEHLRGLMVENAPIPQSHNRTGTAFTFKTLNMMQIFL